MEERGLAKGIVVGGIGGTVAGVTIGSLLAAARAAPPDEKLDYLIEALTVLTAVLAELYERQATLIQLLEQWLAAQGVPGLPTVPTVEVTVRTPWVAKEPEQIFSSSIRSKDTFYSDKMVNWTEGKRILFKVESSLNKAVEIQLIGNISDDFKLGTDVGPSLPCTANGNISIGPAWDDWHPYIGVKITVAEAPTAGILNIWSIVQE